MQSQKCTYQPKTCHRLQVITDQLPIPTIFTNTSQVHFRSTVKLGAKIIKRDHRIKTSNFSWNVGVGSFDPLRVTIQSQFFLGGPWPPRTLLWFFLVVLRCREHEKPEPLDNFRSRRFHFFRFDKRGLSGHGLSKKVWPWKVTVSRSNEQGRIC